MANKTNNEATSGFNDKSKSGFDVSPFVDPVSGRVRLALRVYAVFALVIAVVVIIQSVLNVCEFFGVIDFGFTLKEIGQAGTQALVLRVLEHLFDVVLAVLFVVFSIRILRGKIRYASKITTAMIVVSVLALVVSLMVNGMRSFTTLWDFLIIVFLTVMHTHLDPQLADERKLQHKLYEMETKTDQEEGTLGRDKTGRGYIKMNFFNLFWIFLVACFLGWCFEMIVCPFMNNRIEDRTGLIVGPLSPIYGIGATLMAIVLNRFYKSNPVIVFAIAGVIGAAFEFFVSWFFENAFGIKAWDYTVNPPETDWLLANLFQGRTDMMHFVAWGMLGLVFLRWILPFLLKVINKIPWNWRYGVTCVVAAFMAVNCFMTLVVFDCWYQRSAGNEPDTPVAQFCAKHFDDDWMHKRFPTMTMDPGRAAHD